jgi:hypothetical protein
MTEAERLDRLERIAARLLDALWRKGTEQDGNWGYQNFREEVADLLAELRP